MEQTGRPGRKPRALVVGAGVAGLAAASSLHRADWDVVVCERADARRTGGYFVRLAPEGVAAADRLGAGDGLYTRLPADGVITGVDGRGRTVSRVDASLGDDPAALALVRGDLERALWDVCPTEVEVRFDTVPRRVRSRGDGVRVVLEGPEASPDGEDFDLLVGADGVRSTVRSLVFGPDECFRREFDHVVVSAVLPRLPGAMVEGDYVVQAEPGRTAHLMAMAGHDPVVFFTYRADLAAARGTDPADDPTGALRAVYGDFAGLMPEILDGVLEGGTTHVDTVAQIHLDRWHTDRVVLVGDAAWCPTLYSGQGSALALAGGESLGTHLAAHPGNVVDGLAAWERAQRPNATAAGSAARRSRHFFLPGNRVVAALRWAALRLASWRPAGRVVQAVATAAAARTTPAVDPLAVDPPKDGPERVDPPTVAPSAIDPESVAPSAVGPDNADPDTADPGRDANGRRIHPAATSPTSRLGPPALGRT